MFGVFGHSHTGGSEAAGCSPAGHCVTPQTQPSGSASQGAGGSCVESEQDLEFIFLECLCSVVWLCSAIPGPWGQKHRSEEETPLWAAQAHGLLFLGILKILFCLPSRATLLERMREKKYLMELDVTLVKSWLCVLPLRSLAEFIKDFSSDLLVTLQGVSYRLENVDFSRSSREVCLLAALPTSGIKAQTGLLAVFWHH